MSSETEKYRDLTAGYCKGNGIDVGSQGDPVVPWAIQIELPDAEYAHYTGGKKLEQAGVWRGDGRDLPFKDETLSFVYSSHLIEDFEDWNPALAEWLRVLRKGGHLIVLTPDNTLWDRAVAGGQTPNCAHRHCGRVGEFTEHINKLSPNSIVLEDRLTNLFPGDYTILAVARKSWS